MQKINNNLYRIRCEGGNLTRLINYLKDNDVHMENIFREDYLTLEFSINDASYKKMKSLNLSNYNIKIKNIGGWSKFLHFVYFRMGLIIGLVCAIVLLFLMQNRMFNLTIMGLNTMNKSEVEKSLEELGIKPMSLMNFDKSKIENYLCEKFNFSYVSIITRGNSLIINIKEALPEIDKSYQAITSPYNMVITKMNVFSGTSSLKIGDVVFIGDVLVEPYQIINNEMVEVSPCAEIEGDVFFSQKYDFFESQEIMERTGKSKIIESKYQLGKLKLFNSFANNPYENYEIETVDNLISNYFLPIKVNKTIAYELKKVTKQRNFDEEKNKIIDDLKKQVYSSVPENLVVENEEIAISSTKYGFIVTIYLKSSVYLNQNIK